MVAKEFPEVNVRMAENQEEFETLPAFYNAGEGSITFCFELSKDEVNRIRATNEIWFSMLTHGKSMQPIVLSTNKEELIGRAVKYREPNIKEESFLQKFIARKWFFFYAWIASIALMVIISLFFR